MKSNPQSLMKFRNFGVTSVLAITALSQTPLLRAATYSNTGNGNWTNGAIWSSGGSSGVAPGTLDTADQDSGNSTLTVNSVVNPVNIYTANSGLSHTLTIASGGVLGFTGTSTTNTNFQGQSKAGGTLTVNLQSGGTITTASAAGPGGISFGSAGATIVNQTGGSLISKGDITLGSGTATYNFSSGTTTIGGVFRSGGSLGSFNWTGGTLAVSSVNFAFSNTGAGNLEVGGIGRVGTLLLTTNNSSYTQGSGANMTFDIASGTSFDTFMGTGTNTHVTLSGTLAINLLAGFTPTSGSTFDLITGTTGFGITDNGIILGGNGGTDFTYQIIGGNDLRLTAISVPEPISVALLAVGGIGALVIRRRMRRL